MANALAIWRTHGFDEILREAWEQGVVLMGWSAGMSRHARERPPYRVKAEGEEGLEARLLQ